MFHRIIHTLCAAFLAAGLAACGQQAAQSDYFDNTGREDVLAGGVRMIEIQTPDGPHKVWTKRVGANPKLKLLLLHGGPAFTHDYFEAFDSYLPAAGVEYYYYDQLGAGRSDRPDNDDLWTIPRFVDEVEQVRVALGLDETNFCILGHSWGGILAIEYVLAHQDKLKCVIVSNMMASIPAYNEYAAEVLAPGFDPAALEEIKALEAAKDFTNPRYMELLTKQHYEKHILRMPAEEWPEPVNHSFAMHNQHIYELMQGPSEFRASGRLENWDRTADLEKITVPVLTVGGLYDTMDPKHMEWMASQTPKGQYLATSGSHMALYDDQETYMRGVIGFLKSQE
ncbi:MAG: proline iminopeptidase-family hydrolase [Pseudomonadota bacterium]|nr:proline iminopeptidase-family hydrolase [Pseudomonadota bacterium]